MSGTSLDGVDLALCRFSKTDKWEFEILAADTIPYHDAWRHRLTTAHSLNGQELTKLDREYGNLLGILAKDFLDKHSETPDLIASHGHTIFHRPERGFTLQVGHGAGIYARTGIPVVYDFRSQDVALGGQGAPLVPVGDELLFGRYEACLNLGGFANISLKHEGKRIAWDICELNTVLNMLAGKLGMEYDRGGEIAKKGKLISSLYHELNRLEYYDQMPPKSLGIEWVNEMIIPLLDESFDVEDLLHTCLQHCTDVIAKEINDRSVSNVFVTGGGAYNTYLTDLLKQKCKTEIIIPDDFTVQYKEALIFALLGLLRVRNEVNVLSSVTGALRDHSSGIVAGAVNHDVWKEL